MSSAPLWTIRRHGGGDAARRSQGALPEAITGLSIDSRTIAPGDAYLRDQGRRP